MTLHYPESCNNTPKHAFIRDIISAFCAFNWDFIEKHVSDDFEMHWPGEKPLIGKKPFLKFMREFNHPRTTFLEVESIIGHGLDIATYGKMEIQDETQYTFADFYHLTEAESLKLNKIVSLVIKHE